jgi:hypothetical protein
MKNEIFICDCYSPEHQIIFATDIFEENEQIEGIFFQVHLTTCDNFFKRLWKGLKFAFGHKSKYGEWDMFIFNRDDIDELDKVIQQYKKVLNKQQMKNQINLNIDPTEKELFVLIEYGNNHPQQVIGVCTDYHNAIEMLDEYYNQPYSKEEHIQDSTVECKWIYHIKASNPWEESYTAIVYMNKCILNKVT